MIRAGDRTFTFNRLDILKRAVEHDRTLRGRRNLIVSRLWLLMLRAGREGRPVRIRALSEMLDLLAGHDPDQKLHRLSLALGKEEAWERASGPEARRLMLEQIAAGTASPAWLEARLQDLHRDLKAAVRARDWAEVWRLGSLISAAGTPAPTVLASMIGAAPHHPDARREVVGTWSWLRAISSAELPKISRAGLKQIAEQALCIAQAPGRWEHGAAVVLDLVATAGAGLAALETLIEASTDDPERRAALIDLSPDHDGTRLFVDALCQIASGRQGTAADLFRAALRQGLRDEAHDCAVREVQAATFQLMSPGNSANEDGLVLIEQGAMSDLVRVARSECRSLDISAPLSVSTPLVDDLIDRPPAYKMIDLPEVARAASFIADWVIDHVSAACSGNALFRLRSDEDLFRAFLVRAFYSKLRILYNASTAVNSSPAAKLFFICNGEGILSVYARHLIERGCERQVRIANAATRARARRMADLRLPGAPSTPTRRSAPPPGLDVDPGELATRLVGTLQPGVQTSKPVCVVVVTRSRGDILSPLPGLIMALARVFHPVVLYVRASTTQDLFVDLLEAHPEYDPSRVTLRILTTGDLRLVGLGSEGNDLADALDLVAVHGVPHVFDKVDITALVAAQIAKLEEANIGVSVIRAWLTLQIKRHPPAVMLVQHAMLLETDALCKVARAHGVPTLWLQLMQHSRDVTLSRPFARHHLVLDAYSQSLWRDHLGIDVDDITVVGSLRADASQNEVRGLSGEVVRAELGIPPGQRYALVATQPLALAENLVLLDIVMEALRPLLDVSIVVKLHPTEPEDRVDAYQRALTVGGFKARSRVFKQAHLYRLIVGSEIVVVKHSTVGAEAVLLDRCVISITTGTEIDTFTLEQHGVADVISDAETAVRTLRALVTLENGRPTRERRAADAKRRDFLAANPELHDGGATQRIVAAVSRLASVDC